MSCDEMGCDARRAQRKVLRSTQSEAGRTRIPEAELKDLETRNLPAVRGPQKEEIFKKNK